jgi:hypothetical protein
MITYLLGNPYTCVGGDGGVPEIEMREPKLLVVKGKAGFGNRILSVLTAIIYARLTHRTLLVDWCDFTYSQDGSNSFHRLFESPQIDSVAEIPDTESVYPEIWKGRLRKSANDLMDEFDPDQHSNPRIYQKYSPDFRRLDYPEQVLVMWCFTHHLAALRKHFQGRLDELVGMTDDEILRKLLHESLRPRAIVAERVDDFRSKNFGSKVIGVHIRFMDRKTSIATAHRALRRLRSSYPDTQIFLATDSADAQTEFRKEYGTIIRTEKWFPVSGASMHQNLECEDRFHNGVQALIDMYLLASCNYLIYPGSSTFSNIARLISEISADNVVDTERYNLKVRLKRVVRSWIA